MRRRAFGGRGVFCARSRGDAGVSAMTRAKVFITGVCGLIGGAARDALKTDGFAVAGCDLRSANPQERFDFRDAQKLRAALEDCDGVLHLAAVSRVVWGETHPNLCRAINEFGTKTLMDAFAEYAPNKWLICASSREVYGTPEKLPCAPSSPMNPENLYARTKLACENMAWALRARGLRVAVMRFSNVFGSVDDYPDRVIPAFCAAAARNGTLNVYGGDSLLDFTPLQDAVAAVARITRAVNDGASDLPPIDIVTGRASSLMDMAKMAVARGGGKIVEGPPVAFYPSRFQGDPRPAKTLLGWESQTTIEDAVARFVSAYKQAPPSAAKNHMWLDSVA